MRKLYLTHNPAELIMAWIQFECVLMTIWMAYMVDDNVVLRYLIGHVALLPAIMVYVFLFTMSGSRAREEAAKQKEVAHG